MEAIDHAVAGNANDEGETEPHINIIINPTLEFTRQKVGNPPYQRAAFAPSDSIDRFPSAISSAGALSSLAH